MDQEICGTWDEVQVEMGLKKQVEVNLGRYFESIADLLPATPKIKLEPRRGFGATTQPTKKGKKKK